MDSVFLVPTRGRPQNALRLINAWPIVATTSDTHLHLAVDDDDPELEGYLEIFMDRSLDDSRFGFTVAPRLRLGGTLNALAPELAGRYDAVGFMGDDHLPRTDRWDAYMSQVIADRPGAIVYGNDLIQGANLPTAVLVDSRVIRALGFMVPPVLSHMYLDNFWRDLGTQLQTLVYLEHVVIEHLHPIAGKADWDSRYEDTNEMMHPDGTAWALYVEDGSFMADVARVEKALEDA